MRIVYVSDERYPSTHTDTQQVAMTVDALTKVGANVSLMVPAMRRSSGVRPGSDDKRRLDWTSQSDAIRSYYGVSSDFRLIPLYSVNPEWRILTKTLHSLLSQSKLRGLRPDVVYTRNIGTAAVATIRGFPVILESYRVIDVNYYAFSRFWRSVVSRRNFLGVICHSRMSGESFVRVGVPDFKVQVIHNGFDIGSMKPEISQKDARKLLNWDETRFTATYTGHLNPNKGVDVLAQWAASTPSIHHVWVGGGNNGNTDYAAHEKERAGAANVELVGWVPPAELPPYLYASDALLIPPTAKPLTQHGSTVLPMKTFTYMAAGRAIIAPDLPDVREVLVHEKNALLVEPDRLDVAQSALLRLQRDPQFAQEIGRNAKMDSISATWTSRAEKILRFVERRLQQS